MYLPRLAAPGGRPTGGRVSSHTARPGERHDYLLATYRGLEELTSERRQQAAALFSLGVLEGYVYGVADRTGEVVCRKRRSA